ncbi:MAG: murein biosynthesis integral membrane protein MurJ [Ktedonobacterales bacterium]
MGNQIVVTAHFGAGATMDAYIVATSLPLLLTQPLITVIQGSVIPSYARLRTHGTNEQVSMLFSTLLNMVLLGSAVLTIVMLIFRHQVIVLSAPALDPQRQELAVGLAPYVFPVLLLMLMVGFLQSILNTEGEFGWPAYAGVLVPLTTVAVVVLAPASVGIVALAVGTLAGVSLQLGVCIVRVRRAKIVYRPVLDLRNTALSTIGLAAWPLLFTELMAEVSPFVDQVVASFLSAGNIAAISYALKLISVPASVIFVSVQRAALPHMSRQAAAKDIEGLKKTLHLNIWATAMITAMLSILILIIAHPLVQILFQHGAFTAAETDRTAAVLRGFAVGLVPMALGFIVPDAFVALGVTRVLIYINTFSITANVVFDFVLAHFWQGFGIALATSLVYLCSSCIKILVLRHMIGNLGLLTPPPQLLDLYRKVRYRT